MISTVLICSDDPALRVVARMSFADEGWYLFECSPGDVVHFAKSFKLDAVILLGAAERWAPIITEAFSHTHPLRHVLCVSNAAAARDVAARALGR